MDKSKKSPPNKNQCCGLHLGCYEFVEMKKKIKDLEAKLEEKETDIIALDTENYSFKQQIDSLRQQLAEKDELLKQKIGDMKSTDFIKMCIKSGFIVKAKENDNQTAIRELEKVKGFLLEKIAEKQSCFDSGNYNDFADGVKTICEIMVTLIDKRIKNLKGEEQ